MKELVLYQRNGAVPRMWRHIQEVAPYEGGGAISRMWRYINEVAPYEEVALYQ